MVVGLVSLFFSSIIRYSYGQDGVDVTGHVVDPCRHVVHVHTHKTTSRAGIPYTYEGTCSGVQYSTLSEMELPACDLAEDLIVTALGSLWSGNFLSSGELPSGNDQKLCTSISAGFQYPDGVFDQDNRRETWVKNATLANGFLWTTSVAHATTVAKNLHLECYRKNPNV